MSSRNIAVRKDVYDTLRRDRRRGESFTGVLLRLLHRHGSLEELVGAWPRRAPRSELRRLAVLRPHLREGRP
ncbi:MAG: antitoxin VapB family protein [Thermoplasmata archaeon]